MEQPAWEAGQKLAQKTVDYLFQKKRFDSFATELRQSLEKTIPGLRADGVAFYANSSEVDSLNRLLFKRPKAREHLDSTEDNALTAKFKLFLQTHTGNYTSKTMIMYTTYLFTGG